MKAIRTICSALMGCFFFMTSLEAQTDTRFWFAAPDLQQLHNDRPILFRFSTGNLPAAITISQPANPNFPPISLNLVANSSFSQDLTALISQIENSATNIISNKGILIESDNPINCYYDIGSPNNGDLFALKGENALGIEFTVPFQMDINTWVRTNATYLCEFVVVATEDNTTITVIPSRSLVGHPAGAAFSIVLNRGETYVFTSSSGNGPEKPGGTIVKSDKPIAITTKDDSIQLPGQPCGDTAGDQLIPDRLAGVEFVLIRGYLYSTPNVNNLIPDYYYVFATQDGTVVTTSDGSTASINRGQFFSGKLNQESVYVTSNKPVQVFQITGFGCEVGGAIIPSLKCTGSTQVTTIKASQPSEQFYLNILCESNIINDFSLNGNPSIILPSAFAPVPGTNGKWVFQRFNVPATLVGTGQSLNIQNNSGKFHLGVIQGGATSTARFGYFSDFSANTILLRDPADPSSLIRDEKTFCYNSTATVNALDPDNNLTFSWSGPNGFSSSGATLNIPGYDATNTGLYTITASGGGCGTSKKTIRLLIDKPTASFSFTTDGCADGKTRFDGDPAAGKTWKWDFGGGTIQITTDAFINDVVLGRAGLVPVSLSVGSAAGCYSPVVTKEVPLSDRPRASFQLPATTCERESITLTDNSTIGNGTIVQWVWDLNDGNGFVQKTDNSSVTATYPTWGSKNVKLAVTSQTGCVSDTFRLVNGLQVHPLPQPGFVLPEICLNDAIAQFVDTTKSPDNYSTFSYQWEFNAGATPVTPGPVVGAGVATQKNPSVTYRSIGRYEVKLTVTSRGCVNSIMQSFKVNGANPIPKFDIVTPGTLCSNDYVSIINQSTIDLENVTRLEIIWDASNPTLRTVDEAPEIGKSYKIVYPNFQSPASRSINIELIAYSGNDLACRKSDIQTISLNASPKVSFNQPAGICLEVPSRQFTEASSDPSVPGTFEYSGPGINRTGLFEPILAGAGTHAIKYLFISSLAGACRDSATRDIIVWPRPTSNFDLPTITCEKNDLLFTPTALANAGSLVEWNWDMGDGASIPSSSTNDPFVYRFAGYNRYAISLWVKTNNGCTSEVVTKSIDVNPLPIPSFALPNVCLPLGKAIFMNSTTIPNNRENMTYRWDFGDPFNTSSSTTKDGVHYYSKAQPYNVKLIATDPITSCKDSTTQELKTVFNQPKAVFNSKDFVCLGEKIEFTDASTTPDGTIEKWNWYFETGATANKQIESYLYKTPGKKTVLFYIQNSVSCFSDTIQKEISVYSLPTVSAGPDLYVLSDGSKQMESVARGDSLSYSWSPPSYLSATNVLQPLVINPKIDTEYKLTVIGKGGCSRSDIVKIIALEPPEIPNTITPNGDGINDTWVIKFLDRYPGALTEIYTDKGQLIYRSINNSKAWDGTYQGKLLPAGTYYYVIDPKSGREKIAGYISLLR